LDRPNQVSQLPAIPIGRQRYCRAYRGGKGGTMTLAPNHWGGGAETSLQYHKHFFNTVHLLPKGLRFKHGGAKHVSWPLAPSNLDTPLFYWGCRKPICTTIVWRLEIV